MMAEWEYVRLMGRNYLQIKIVEQEFEELFQYRMIMSSPIKGLLECRTREINGETFFLYDMSSMQSLSSMYAEKKMDFSIFYQLIYALNRTVNGMKEYLLEINNLLLYPEFIFQELDTKEFRFVCCPCGNNIASNSTKKLYDFFVASIDYEDAVLTDIVYQLYEQIEEENDAWIEILYKKFRDIEEEREKENKELQDADEIRWKDEIEEKFEKQEVGTYPFEENSEKIFSPKKKLYTNKLKVTFIILLFYIVAVACGIYYLYANYELSSSENLVTWTALIVITAVIVFWLSLWLKKEKGKDVEPIADKDMEILKEYREEQNEGYLENDSYGKTIFFEAEEVENKLYGIGRKNRQTIRLNKFPYIIGKKEGMVDGLIEEASISRMHAKFYQQDKIIYLEDLNSTNGTYKNGIMLAPHEKVEVLPEDEIRFGKLQFIYR